MGITLLTPTGGRPEAFALCERWIARQTYRGEIQWLVADDGATPTACTMGQTVVRPEPFWTAGQNTQHRNLLALLPRIRHDAVLHIEDDDWYAASYVETMARRLEMADMVGERPARYYNVRYRSWHDCGNDKHASLFQTGMRTPVIEILRQICQRRQWIDMTMWPAVAGSLLFTGEETVGIKGMPGRPGQVVSHRRASWLTPDLNYEVLQRWVGVEDAAEYRRFADV